MRPYNVVWALAVFGGTSVFAETVPVAPPITAGGESAVLSRYVWRGLAFSDGAVSQSSLWVTAHGLTLTVWNNAALDRSEHYGRTNEVDYVLSGSRDWHGLSVEPSLTHYTYPHDGGPSTTELEFGLSHDIHAATVFLRNYVDVQRYHGSAFVETGVSNVWQVAPKIPLTASVTVGAGTAKYHEVYAGIRKGGPSYVAGAVSADINAGKAVIRPSFQWSSLIGRRLRESATNPTLGITSVAVDWNF